MIKPKPETTTSQNLRYKNKNESSFNVINGDEYKEQVKRTLKKYENTKKSSNPITHCDSQDAQLQQKSEPL